MRHHYPRRHALSRHNPQHKRNMILQLFNTSIITPPTSLNDISNIITFRRRWISSMTHILEPHGRLKLSMRSTTISNVENTRSQRKLLGLRASLWTIALSVLFCPWGACQQVASLPISTVASKSANLDILLCVDEYCYRVERSPCA